MFILFYNRFINASHYTAVGELTVRKKRVRESDIETVLDISVAISIEKSIFLITLINQLKLVCTKYKFLLT